ncbi:MAG: prenyltransferase/squalene oxidase repeat-containing protein, partial [Tepidisphaeraceae bacterium]
ERAQAMLDKSLAYLKTQQKPDGGWQNPKEPVGITALVLRAFVGSGSYTANDAFVRKGFERLLSYQQKDGGIYEEILANYNTAIAASAIAAANDPTMKAQLDHAIAYLKSEQWIEGNTQPKGEKLTDKSDSRYGGFGYNRHSSPDLSNSHFAIQALHDAGLKPDDPAYKNAMVFISRCQNFSETNDQPWSGNDGGFIYSAGNGGDSEAESYVGPDGRKMWRSYGSMTYAGLKSMIYAGVTRDDPRVRAAVEWIRRNWTLDENPGMRLNKPEEAQHGLYYYFQVMAKALHTYGEPTITDARGVSHDWRIEMIDKLEQLQQPDGSFIGEKRWMENNPVLVTAYVSIALEEILKDLKQN